MATQAAGRPKGRDDDMESRSEMDPLRVLSGAQHLVNDLERARYGLQNYLTFDTNFLAFLEDTLEYAIDYVKVRESGY